MARRPFLDPDHPMFARAWVRWLVSILPFGWGVGELVMGSPMWGMVFAGLGAYAFWTLILGKR